MQVFPNTTLMFARNNATEFGGAFAVENYIAKNDSTLILNNLCFIQYNIGSEDEYKPDKWKVSNQIKRLIYSYHKNS